MEANNALMAKREEVQRLADIEEAAMLEYATGKEKDLLARRDREEERFRARQAWRQSLIDKQVAALTDMNAAQNARLENQAREKGLAWLGALSLDESKWQISGGAVGPALTYIVDGLLRSRHMSSLAHNNTEGYMPANLYVRRGI